MSDQRANPAGAIGEDVPKPKAGQRADHGVLSGIQYLRGWAAILVLFTHDDEMMGKPEFFGHSLFGLVDTGAFAVSVFFCISGFIIAIVSLSPKTLAPVIGVRRYAERRFLRIVPFMWLAVIGYNLLSFAGTHQLDAPSMLRAMVAWPVGELKPNVLWSLRHEFLFYLLFALSMLGARRRPWLLILWVLAPLAAIPAWQFLIHAPFGQSHPVAADLIRVWFAGSDVGANLQFGVGLLFGILYLRDSPLVRERPFLRPWLCLAMFLLGAMAIERLGFPVGISRALSWTLVAGAIFWLGLTISVAGGVFHRINMMLGNASFAIYLVHNPLLLILLQASRHIHAMPPLLFLCLSAILATIGGVLVHLWVERPLLDMLTGKRRKFAADMPVQSQQT